MFVLSYTTLSLRDAINQELLTSLTTDFDLLEDDVDTLVVRIYQGDTILHEYLDLSDLFAENNTAGIIVNGNLTVNAPIIDFEIDTISCFLIVNGSLTCKSLAAGCAEIIVSGDVHAADAVIAFYNHGNIEITGDLNAKLLIVDQHGITIKGKTHAATFCTGWHIAGADFSNWRHIFLPAVADELLDEDDYFFAGDVRFLHMLKDGKPLFKSDLKISADNNPVAKEATWDEIRPLIQHLTCKYEAFPFANNEKSDEGMADVKFLLYDGTTVLDELDLDTEEYMGIIVVGDLHVKGSIINENTDGACSLIVLGHLKAKNMCVGGQLIYIDGYIAIEEMLMGVYNHGELYSTSYVWCPAVIDDDYHFYFHEYANVKVLDITDDDDKEIIKEILIDELFDEEEGFVLYDTIRQGIPLLKPAEKLDNITQEHLEEIINLPLIAPDEYSIAFPEDGWHITIDKGGHADEDGDVSPSSLIAIHLDNNKYFYWYLSEDGAIATMIKQDEEWVLAAENDQEDVLKHFALIRKIIRRKLLWNERHIKKVDQELLWKLVWMFRNGQEETEFQTGALVICQKVLYAATYPFAYIFGKYSHEAEYRGLAENADWAPAAALIDGLIQWGFAQEIIMEKSLAEQSDELDFVTQYNWGVTYEIPEEYNTQPIDKNFMMETNEELLNRDGALLRLDVGIGSFILAGMHINDVEILNQLMHPLGVYPKYYTFVMKKKRPN